MVEQLALFSEVLELERCQSCGCLLEEHRTRRVEIGVSWDESAQRYRKAFDYHLACPVVASRGEQRVS